MSEPTTQFTPNTRWYIQTYGYLATKNADLLNISSLAVVGVIANEYDTRYNYDLFFDKRGFMAQKFGDFWVLKLNNQPYSNQEIIDYYNDFKTGKQTSKWDNPTAIDIGPGNIKVVTAIDMIEDYSKTWSNTGQDPLGLLKYKNSYDSLIIDLLSFKDPATSFSIAALYLRKGENFFKTKNEAAWNRLNSDQKDALLVTYYKLGEDVIEKNINISIAKSIENGTEFNYNPNGDGGQQHLNNLDIIKSDYNDSKPPKSVQNIGDNFQKINNDDDNSGIIITNTGIIFDLNIKDDVLKAEQAIRQARINGDAGIDLNSYNLITSVFSSILLHDGLGSTVTITPPDTIVPDDIGAFYENSSSAFDTAASISAKTGRVFAASTAQTAAQLAALDANKDGKLTGDELGSLSIWQDTNENGINDAGELKTLAAAGITSIRSTDYGLYSAGNGVMPASITTTSTMAFAPDRLAA